MLTITISPRRPADHRSPRSTSMLQQPLRQPQNPSLSQPGASKADTCNSHKVYYGISIFTIRSYIYADLLPDNASVRVV